jgi:squalene cyclase
MGLALAGASAAPPAADTERSGAALFTPAAQGSIERGLAWLARQQHDDGSFGTGSYDGNVAVTALGGMAFMAGGSTPDRGPYGRPVSRTLDYLLANAQPSGFIVAPRSPSRGPMYGHGFATLFLAECYGMSPRAELREALAKAVKLIVNTQNKDGGWRYFPRRDDADISVTICQVMALRAARNAGFHVPKESIERCIEYVKRCQNADGGFRYQLEPSESGFGRTAAGVVALNSAGIYDSAEVRKGLAYLMRYLPPSGLVAEAYYEYAHYYAAQAMWHAGGEHWSRWYPAIRDELIARQRPEGFWLSSVCVDYGTSMACIILQMPNNELPIFQR